MATTASESRRLTPQEHAARLLQRGRQCAYEGDWETAKKKFSQALEVGGASRHQQGLLLYYLALIYYIEGWRDEAEASAQHAQLLLDNFVGSDTKESVQRLLDDIAWDKAGPHTMVERLKHSLSRLAFNLAITAID